MEQNKPVIPKSPTIKTMQVRVDLLKEMDLPNNGTDWDALIAPYLDWKFVRGDHIDVVLRKPESDPNNLQSGDYEILDGLLALAWRKRKDIWDFQD